ncbi:hypothetical protein FALBO_105 [Fusarium albosuccineum]|uniref:Uncharacterized protein n=1 Tax=Fusarium albosuccineum TaxID=1237068 RepID=A0A8H4LNQ9_9HYPO|nr:hypothetical protein FALBO_105 [Fusarium albosuccineum]
MKPYFFLLLGGTASAVLTGPYQPPPPPPPSSSSLDGSASTTRDANTEATPSTMSDGVPSDSSGVDMPPGSDSTSNLVPGPPPDTTWPTFLMPVPHTSGQPGETHDSHVVVETTSGTESTGDSTATTTQTGADGQDTATVGDSSGINTETGADGEGTETGSASTTFNSETGTSTQSGSVSTDTAETGGNGQDTETGSVSASATTTGSENIPSNSGSTELETSETKTTGANEETGTSTDDTNTATETTSIETTATDDGQSSFGSQTTEPNTHANGSTTVGVTTSTGGSQDETSSDGSDTTSIASTTTADDTTETNSGPATGDPAPSSETSASQPEPSSSETAGQETSTETDDTNGTTASIDPENPTATLTITDSASPQTTEPGATITPGPISTTKSEDDDGITSTLTVPPESFSPTTVSNDEWTTNTWITTTSEGSDEPTVVPVLVGCPECGGDGHGVVIFGFPPTPNTVINIPGFPSFSFPCIPGLTPGCNSPPKSHDDNGSDENEDDNDDNDDDDDEDDEEDDEEEQSSSTTCTDTITASDCLVSCPTEDSNGEAECTTTCTKTHTGCNVSGVTTTTSAQECSATGGSCSTCQKDIFVVNDNEEVELVLDDDSVLQRRGALSKRGKAEKVDSLASGICKLNKAGVAFPGYPGGTELWDADNTPNSQPSDRYHDTPKWFIARRDPNTCARSLAKVDKQDFEAQTSDSKKKKTVDHAYEKSMMRDFWTQILDNSVPTVQGVTQGSQGKINCADLAYYTNDDSGVPGPNLLEDVYNAFPSRSKYRDDFIGMDHYTNSICKGTIVTPENIPNEVTNLTPATKLVQNNTPWQIASKWMDNILQMLEKLSIGVELWNSPDVQTIAIRQNRRIHSRFVNLDNNAKNCKNDDAVINNVWSFSAAYQKYMNELFQGTPNSINTIVQKAADDLIKRMDDNFAALQQRGPSLSSSEQSDVANWQVRYAPLKTATYQVSITWDFSYTNLRKRQDDEGDDEFEEGAACPLPTSSPTSSVTSSMSTFSTSYISTTTDEPTLTTETATPTESEWNGTCPTASQITVQDGKLPDGVGERCLCKSTSSSESFEPFTADQLEDALQDFCDGSRTIFNPDPQWENVAKHYKLGDTSGLFISASWTIDSEGVCDRPSGDVELGDNCKTALRRLKCQDMENNYGGSYIEVLDQGCVAWLATSAFASDGEFPDEWPPRDDLFELEL